MYDLDISITKIEDTSMSNGEAAFIIYLNIFNNQSKGRKIGLSKATYVTHEGVQLEQDIWLSGYLTESSNIKANAFREAGFIFYKRHLKNVSDKDLLYVELKLMKEKKKLSLEFEREDSSWLIKNTEVSDIEIEFSPKVTVKQLLKKIERLEVFEERFNIYFDKISINISDYFWMYLMCEVHPTNGTVIEKDINIECVLYDKDSQIIDMYNKTLYSEDFFGFEVIKFSFQEDNIAKRIQKIRLYPKNR